MKPTLWFVVPVHGRLALAEICLRQLRRTCDELAGAVVDATAVVIADAENLAQLAQPLDELGFGTIERDNRFLSRRFNDGIQLATDPAYNPRPADYVVPCGSDDWVDWRLFVDLPEPDTIVGFPSISFVRPDGGELVEVELDYAGGAGMRIYPREILERVGYRPGDEDRRRACDTSILTNVIRAVPDVRVEHRPNLAPQLVDWKSEGEQVTGYDEIVRRHRGTRFPDPFERLEGFYPPEALEAMADLYSRRGAIA